MQVFWSENQETCASQPALVLPGWEILNTSVCKGEGRQVMSFEISEPPEEAGVPFTMRFAQHSDLITWRVTPPECVFSRERYTACPALRFCDGYYYIIYIEARACMVAG